MKTLNEIVKQMLDEHGGGSIFFDNLDAEIRNSNELIEHFVHDYVSDLLHKYRIDYVIVSGRFGRVFVNTESLIYQLYYYHNVDTISVNGNLRGSGVVEDFNIRAPRHGEKYNFLFIDDSFYSGKTRDKIKDKIESYGHNLAHTIVLYDGSADKDDNVSSMYRYYDNYNKEEN